MKKIIMILVVIFLLATPTGVVYAGTLNEYESAVVTVARGQFVYNGVTYQAEEGYVQELIGYLMQDDIELTAEQRDYAIESIYANVEQGVIEGYIKPVVVPVSEESQVDTSGEVQTSDEINGEATDDGLEESTEESLEDNMEGKAKDFVEDVINQPSTITKIDNNQGKVTVTDQSNKELLAVNTVIKNTGFNLNTTVMVGIGIIAIMFLCIIVTYRYLLYTPKDQ